MKERLAVTGSKNPQVDEIVDRAQRWREETHALRSILLDCGLREELKWGKPCYSHEGNNLAIIQGFKHHCSVMFFKGALLKDPKGYLVRPGEHSQAAMRMQFTSIGQIVVQEPVLRSFVEQAVGVEKAGLRVDFAAKDALELPEELERRLEQDPTLSAAFDALTPGRRRAYLLHFVGAKQSKTRAARIEKCVARILAGKGLNER